MGDISHSFIVQDILQSIKTPQPGVIAKFNSDYSFSHLTTPQAKAVDSESSDEEEFARQFHPRSQRPTFSYLKSRSVDSLVDIFDEGVQIQLPNKLTLGMTPPVPSHCRFAVYTVDQGAVPILQVDACRAGRASERARRAAKGSTQAHPCAM